MVWQSPYHFIYDVLIQKLENLLYRTYGHLPEAWVFKSQRMHFQRTNILKPNFFLASIYKLKYTHSAHFGGIHKWHHNGCVDAMYKGVCKYAISEWQKRYIWLHTKRVIQFDGFGLSTEISQVKNYPEELSKIIFIQFNLLISNVLLGLFMFKYKILKKLFSQS